MNRENACFVSVNRSFQLQFTKREREREVDAHDWIEATDGTVRPTSSRETNVSINESDIPGKQGSLSLSPSFSIRISLCPGEIVITKGGKNASRSFRSRIDGLDSRMAAAVVVLEQPTTFPEARNKVEERERDWHLRRYTSESRK